MSVLAPPSTHDEPGQSGFTPSMAQACLEDAYWQRFFWRERYYRPEFDYEDYAPAYCVGYVGFAQYGGSFEDAERSLVANWLRIRGDSQLALEEAGLAMRAAWRRMALAADTAARWQELHAQARREALSGQGEDAKSLHAARGETLEAKPQRRRGTTQELTAQP